MVKHNEKADLDLNTNDLSQGVCRICYYDEESGPFGEANKNGSRLINACECSGTSGLYHRYCIEEWVKSSACNQPLTCEICNTPYKFKMYVSS
uniref:RING-CH-type domain-containing protein n=1 Tax=Rhabditophanes sp. KR3021 TaxID=114890 RepID=A0AC35TLJ1_9BILA